MYIAQTLPVIWNYGPDILRISSYPIRWYGLLFATSFILGRHIMIHIYKRENKPLESADTLLAYMMVGTTVGARLGHVIFYEWDYYSKHLLEIILPFRFGDTIHFQGFSGLASHGVVVGIILAIFAYTKLQFTISLNPLQFKVRLKDRPQQTFLYVIDRVVITVALAGCLIRIGNFMNSEIYGKPTDSKLGVIFVRETVKKILNTGNFIERVYVDHPEYNKDTTIHNPTPITLNIEFKPTVTDLEAIEYFLNTKIKRLISTGTHTTDNIYEPSEETLSYTIDKKTGKYTATINTFGIPRHPAQLYESITCLIVFIVLLSIWSRKKDKIREGLFVGLFMIIVFSLRIFYEIFKEGQVVFQTESLTMTNAQVLSIPVIVLGLIFFFWNYKKSPARS